MEKLPYAHDATYNSKLWERKPRCLGNTRVRLLEMVDGWSRSPDSAGIFWLSGMAGTGKSTIARTIADRFAKEGQLGASFFFSRGRGDLGNAGKFLTTIAAQFAGKHPFLKYQVSKAVAENPQIIYEGLGEQWKHLIVRPLTQFAERLSRLRTLAIVIDALDECEDEDDVRWILRLLPQITGLPNLQLRILVTSRPETPIRLGFRSMLQDAHRDFALHEIDRAVTENDIFLFLSHEIEEITKEFGLSPWANSDDIRDLAFRASGLFIYAATACQFIRNDKYSPPRESLKHLMDSPVGASPDASLDEMYNQVLQYSVCGHDKGKGPLSDKLCARFREITGPIVVMFDTMTCTSYSNLIGIEEKMVLAVLGDLSSVLEISNHRPIQLLHPSFRDFIIHPDRCSGIFHIDDVATHEFLVHCCLRVMSNHLREDICDLRAPGSLTSAVTRDRLDRCLPAELRYACRYWIPHIERGKLQARDDHPIHAFLRKHLLHWLEALSLLGKLSEALTGITSLVAHTLVGQTQC